MAVVSIIIPCYNSGAYLPDALASTSAYTGQHICEVIIVDDGSTDETTLSLLESLPNDRYTVLRQENSGPASARNTGIRVAKGEYILFLDSDNKIRPAYIDRGVQALEEHENVGVVYGNAAFFGITTNDQFRPAAFDMMRLLNHNYIDMCSMVRKQVWQQVNGLDEDRRLIGHEDWEFWIRIGKTDWKFLHIDEVLFDYRIRTDSLTTQAAQEQKLERMLSYVYGKHWELFRQYYKYLSDQLEYYKRDKEKPLRTLVKFMYAKYFHKNTG